MFPVPSSASASVAIRAVIPAWNVEGITTVGQTVPVSVPAFTSVCVPISTHPVLVVVALTTVQAVTQEA